MTGRTINGLTSTPPDLPSTHRLPTISAADALDGLDDTPQIHVPTGVDELDCALADLGPDSERRGGVARGQLTEIWGPPGVGKTAVGIQLTANVLAEGHDVVWVDCFHPLCFSRLKSTLNSLTANIDRTPPKGKLIHYAVQTLAHFLALVCRPRPNTFSTNTRLVVIDSFSALLNSSLPKDNSPVATSPTNRAKGRGKGPSKASLRRTQTLQVVVSALQKLAATRDCAVVVLGQCATRMERGDGASSEDRATLVQAIGATVWEQGVATRVVLFRDWAWARDEDSEDGGGGVVGLRFAALQKLNGKKYVHSGSVAAFDIMESGIVNANHDESRQPVVSASQSGRKRKLEHAGIDEIPDSDDGADEDFGWGDDEAVALPALRQWHGSEDLIIGTQRESEAAEEVEEQEEEEEEEEEKEGEKEGEEGEDGDLSET